MSATMRLRMILRLPASLALLRTARAVNDVHYTLIRLALHFAEDEA